MLAIDHRLDRAKMILGYLFVSTLIISIGGPDKLVIMLPVIYILASLGISYMIVSWLEVFPRNPLARYVGIGIVCAVVGLTCIYHLDRYFVAWPNSPDTIKAFHLTRVK